MTSHHNWKEEVSKGKGRKEMAKAERGKRNRVLGVGNGRTWNRAARKGRTTGS